MTQLNVTNNIVLDYHKSLYYQNVTDGYIGYNYFAQAPDSPYLDGELQFDVNCSDISLENNTLYNLTYDGIEIYRSSNFLIQDNWIEDIGAGTHIEHGLIKNITIISNNFVNSMVLANDVIELNIINNEINPGTINIDNCSTVAIINNTICGNPIQTGNSDDVTIEGNEYICSTVLGFFSS